MALITNRGTSRRAAATRLPTVKRRGWRRLWLNEHVHALAWLVVTVVILGSYVYVHSVCESCKDSYVASISDELDNAVKLYTVRPNALTGGLELSVEGTTYQSGTDDAGPLGIGKLPGVKGLLGDTSVALERYNVSLASTIGEILGKFRSSTAHPGYVIADLADVAPEAYEVEASKGPRDQDEAQEQADPGLTNQGDTEQEQADEYLAEEWQYSIRIASHKWEYLFDRNRDETTAELLINAMQGSLVEAVFLGPLPLNPTEKEIEDSLTAETLPEVPAEVRDEVCERLRKIGTKLRPFFMGKDNEPAETIPGKIAPKAAPGETAEDETADDDACQFSSVYAPPTGDERTAETETKGGCSIGMGCYHARLKDFATNGVGFFWTLGPFRWLEMAALALLGVVVRRLIDFSVLYGGLKLVDPATGNPEDTKRWEPRESMRTVMYMVYTPVLALVVIWVLVATDLIAAEAVMLGDWVSHALVPIAFLLGLFPDLGHLVLTRVAQAVFRDIRGARPPASGTERPVQPLEPARTTDGEAPSLDSLRLRIRFIYTRVFR